MCWRAARPVPGPARELLFLLLEPPHRLITSALLLAELVRVLQYPRLLPLHGLTRDGIEEFVLQILRGADVVPLEPAEVTAVVAADPDDVTLLRTLRQA
jgi:predicted nucleic acid-binding protein